MDRLKVRTLSSLFMLALWLGVIVFFLVTQPEFRNPFGGEPKVSLFWFLMVLMFAWNVLRILMAWQGSFDRPKPPIRRAVEDDEENPFA